MADGEAERTPSPEDAIDAMVCAEPSRAWPSREPWADGDSAGMGGAGGTDGIGGIGDRVCVGELFPPRLEKKARILPVRRLMVAVGSASDALR
jgi:hypothetical protein